MQRRGLAVCYDIRFPALFRQLMDLGMEVLALPAAFTAGTGKAHWEMDKEPGVLTAEIGIGELKSIRQRFPVLAHERLDYKY